MTATITSLLVAASVIGVVSASSTSRLQIHVPPSLKKPGGYDHREALFGIPPYGGSIQQQLIYADSTLCSSDVDKRKGYPERPNNAPWQPPFILMVDRGGGCTFVQKVRNAQRVGAAGVLIADNICLCNDKQCMNVTDSRPSECELLEPIMADDGSGSDVSIPSFLVYRQDAELIKDVLKQNQQVRAEMRFSIPQPDERVEYDLWTAPGDFNSRDLLSSFYHAAERLGKDAFFTPHEYFIDGVKAGCFQNGENKCLNLCTNNGRYCSLDPDGNAFGGASGADVVTESLRRLCIWDVYGSDGIGKEWWAYMKAFMDTCGWVGSNKDVNKFKDPACIAAAMEGANINKNKVQQCMDDSGGLTGNVTNLMFEKQNTRMEEMGVTLIPSLFINEAPLRGAISYTTLFEAICAGYAPGSRPEICQACGTCIGDMQGCVERGKCLGRSTATVVSFQLFAMSFLGLILVLGGSTYAAHQRQRRLMRERVRGILGQYMPLDENKAPGEYDIPAAYEEQHEFTIS